MKKTIIAMISTGFILLGCASNQPQSTLSISPEVRKSSQTDETLFRDLYASPGGVGFVDKVLYPNAKASVITKIEVVEPYSGEKVGTERWYIEHDGVSTATYLVKLTPDGKGGTFFSIKPEK